MYLGCMIAVPLFAAVFFVTLLDKGMATGVPSAIVDLDRTPTSRNIVRTLDSFHGVDVAYHLDSYSEAMDYVKQSKIVGFIVIPEGFSSDALALRRPELSYYINFSYYASASLMVKDYTTISALSNASLVSGTLSALGMNEHAIECMLQPYITKVHALGNPWVDYGVYLANSFVPTLLALMVMIMTAYSILARVAHHSRRIDGYGVVGKTDTTDGDIYPRGMGDSSLFLRHSRLSASLSVVAYVAGYDASCFGIAGLCTDLGVHSAKSASVALGVLLDRHAHIFACRTIVSGGANVYMGGRVEQNSAIVLLL